MAEGTGLEPYSPCQGLVRGQGGFQDVHACVDLPVHLPVAHQADEHLAHPISAPGATHWAGLSCPLRVHFDDGHTPREGLVVDQAVQLPLRPRREAAPHLSSTSTASWHLEFLKDDSGPPLFRDR